MNKTNWTYVLIEKEGIQEMIPVETELIGNEYQIKKGQFLDIIADKNPALKTYYWRA